MSRFLAEQTQAIQGRSRLRLLGRERLARECDIAFKDFYPAAGRAGQARAEGLTGSKVKFQILPAGPIGSPLRIYEVVQKSVTRSGHSWLGYDCGEHCSLVAQLHQG